ncbi:MAG: hypothetical protein NTZ48_00840 [Candidatus Omnitrophica bacterium]|nr:hypothetical protein [Candidatus Omnitrophota bacterium]
MNFFELSKPCIKVICSTGVLLITTIFIAPQIREGWGDISKLSVVSAAIFFSILVGAIFSPFWLKEGLDSLSKRHNATKRLDSHSLRLLAEMDGLTYAEKTFDLATFLALRHLISLELIELDAFPLSSKAVSWGYYLTDLGRYILTKNLEKEEIYPKEFCELIRVRYWEGYPAKFIKKKNAYKHNIFSLSWDESWKTFDRVIRKIQPNMPQDDTMTIFLSYFQKKSYDIVMKDLVIPWQEGIAR